MSDRPPFKISIASPCSKSWEQMQGTSQKRFCDSCRKHVYDLSAMRYDEVKELLEREVPPCVRLYQRADGTVLTADCPVGRERRWKKIRRLASLATAALLGWIAVAFTTTRRKECGADVSPMTPIDPSAWGIALANIPPPPSESLDEAWIIERRSRLGVREGARATRRMGLTIGVIRGNSQVDGK
jgi:hypothetical protein